MALIAEASRTLAQSSGKSMPVNVAGILGECQLELELLGRLCGRLDLPSDWFAAEELVSVARGVARLALNTLIGQAVVGRLDPLIAQYAKSQTERLSVGEAARLPFSHQDSLRAIGELCRLVEALQALLIPATDPVATVH